MSLSRKVRAPNENLDDFTDLVPVRDPLPGPPPARQLYLSGTFEVLKHLAGPEDRSAGEAAPPTPPVSLASRLGVSRLPEFYRSLADAGAFPLIAVILAYGIYDTFLKKS